MYINDLFFYFSYKERMRKMYCDDDLDVVEDTSYHIADSSADMSILNMSQ